MKLYVCLMIERLFIVAPFVGAWIEIQQIHQSKSKQMVAPFVGAWIEIRTSPSMRGLTAVAPFVGAWIEMHGVKSNKMGF